MIIKSIIEGIETSIASDKDGLASGMKWQFNRDDLAKVQQQRRESFDPDIQWIDDARELFSMKSLLTSIEQGTFHELHVLTRYQFNLERVGGTNDLGIRGTWKDHPMQIH
jgi:hypothetical protein